MKTSLTPIVLVIIVAIAGCSNQADLDSTENSGTQSPKIHALRTIDTHHYFHKAEEPHAAAWSYEGDSGPTHWGDLSSKYELAKDGKQQSPIDLTQAELVELSAIKFDYRPSKIDLVYNGHTVKEIEDKASSIVVDGKTFVLQQFHFHAPSEHTIDGEHSDMEMHLVHKSKAGAIAVVGVMINSGADNGAFDVVWDYLPTPENRERKDRQEIDATNPLPASHSHYRHQGSFTTPPCTENILWMVLANPIELSENQIARFCEIIKGNNCPVQPLNGRSLKRSK